MKRRQILVNAAMSVVQIASIGVVIFVLYRFLLATIGVKKLGIWSLILSTSSLAQAANFGFSGSVVKFVAKYSALKESQNVSRVIETAAVSLAAFVGLALLISYPAIKKILGLVVENESLPMALAILPYALFSLWLMMLLSVFQSALDGHQRIDLRNVLLILSSILNLALCFILAPSYGLMGVAYARVAQMSATLVAAWLVLKGYVKLPIIPWRWNRRLFWEMANYGLKYQSMSVLTMLYDPITKALLSKFGNLSMLGYYEMANRMVQQFRSLIVSANQVLFPAIADLKEREPEKIDSVYRTSYELLFYLAVPLYSLIIMSLPTISQLWIGHYEGIFVTLGILLTAAFFLNTLGAPAYIVNLGTGELGWNVIGNVVIAILNVTLGLSLGLYFGGMGVAAAWATALSLGSSLIPFAYHIQHKIPLAELLPRKSMGLMAICALGAASVFITNEKADHAVVVQLAFLIAIFVGLWFHPMRKRLKGWVRAVLLDSKTPMR